MHVHLTPVDKHAGYQTCAIADMTNKKYRIVLLLNLLQRMLREVRASADADRSARFAAIFEEHALNILRITAPCDRRYAEGRLKGMLEEADLLGSPLLAVCRRQATLDGHHHDVAGERKQSFRG